MKNSFFRRQYSPPPLFQYQTRLTASIRTIVTRDRLYRQIIAPRAGFLHRVIVTTLPKNSPCMRQVWMWCRLFGELHKQFAVNNNVIKRVYRKSQRTTYFPFQRYGVDCGQWTGVDVAELCSRFESKRYPARVPAYIICTCRYVEWKEIRITDGQSRK